MYDLGITGGYAYINGSFRKTNIYIQNGTISHIGGEELPCDDKYDAAGKKIIPGLMDPHVHFDLDTGSHTSCDDFQSGSVSAAYGGITTFFDFLDPVSDAGGIKPALEKRMKMAEGSIIDYSFHATLANPAGHTKEMVDEAMELGLSSIKVFTTYSESGRRTYDREIRELLALSKDRGFVLMVHAENDNMVEILPGQKVWDITYARNEEAEISEALNLAGMVEETGGELYMVHVSSGHTVQALASRYPNLLGRKFHIETCPHYLYFNLHEYDRNDGYLYTMIPPLRSRRAQGLLLNNAPHIETVGTDHCPYMRKEKNKEYLAGIPMGVGGVEYSFPAMYGFFGKRAIDMMSLNPARIFGLYPGKGVLMEGSDADIAIFSDNGPYIKATDHSKCDYSIYTEGRGAFASMITVDTVISRGRFVIRDKELKGGKGKCLLS